MATKKSKWHDFNNLVFVILLANLSASQASGDGDGDLMGCLVPNSPVLLAFLQIDGRPQEVYFPARPQPESAIVEFVDRVLQQIPLLDRWVRGYVFEPWSRRITTSEPAGQVLLSPHVRHDDTLPNNGLRHRREYERPKTDAVADPKSDKKND